MSFQKIESEAFQRAELKSESHRITGLLVLLGALMFYVILRGSVTGEYRLLAAQMAVLIAAAAYEVAMLATVKRALKNETEVSLGIVMLNVLIETQLPTIAIVLLIKSGLVEPQTALVSPAVLLYFLFIILSTLRLSPGLCILTGLAAVAGYAGVTLWLGIKDDAAPGGLPIYLLYAVLIYGGGVVAAIVAGQIRNHVFAALKEAMLKRELDRINHDLDIARSIQQGLLPATVPSLEQFDLAGWNQPANQTGGDYFDWQLLPDGQVAISLADATGHGIGPALVSTSCRAYARASFVSGNGQGALLKTLNRLLSQDLSANRFVTFAVVFLEPALAQIRVLSAGHGPILWYRRNNDVFENLKAHGIPLGMLEGAEYEGATARYMEHGDLLVLVTDGFYEWANRNGEEFGLARLEAVIRESRDYSATEIIARLRAAVAKFCQGTEQQDDLTAVVLKRKFAGHAAEFVSAQTEVTDRSTLQPSLAI
jgi:serine phosphatase RsbU (regulator of sigma subunit)